MSDLVEIQFVNIDNVGMCKLPIADIPHKKWQNYQKMMKDEETIFDGMIEMLSWVIKDDNSKAFNQEYLDDCSMNKAAELCKKLSEGMPKAIEDTKKK